MTTTLPACSAGKPGAAKPLQLVGFRVGHEEYGFEILKVQEIIRMIPVTTVPNAPPHVEGIIDLRGRIVPIVDFRKRFNIAGACPVDDLERVIVVTLTNNTTIGFIVDSLSQVMKVPPDSLSPAPLTTAGYDGDAIRGVANLGDRLVIALDVDRLFSAAEVSDLAGAVSPG